jgi:hypothetical protein
LAPDRAPDLVALDEALEALAAIAPRKCQVVELRFFGGLSIEEICLVTLVIAASVPAQTVSGEVFGKVTDGTGSFLPGV